MITRWFTQPNRPTPTTTAATGQQLPTTKLKQQCQKKSHIQVALHKLLANNHWGDIPLPDPARFRIISKNVNSLSTTDNHLQWRGAIQAMQDLDAHILCIQEPNIKWSDTFVQPIYRLFQQTFMHAKLTYSACLDTICMSHQPGGTFLAITGCYATRVITTGADSTGLGCWSYSELVRCNGR